MTKKLRCLSAVLALFVACSGFAHAQKVSIQNGNVCIVTGGETKKLVKGDVLVIPAGIPHWFKEVSPTVSYFVVKGVKQ